MDSEVEQPKKSEAQFVCILLRSGLGPQVDSLSPSDFDTWLSSQEQSRWAVALEACPRQEQKNSDGCESDALAADRPGDNQQNLTSPFGRFRLLLTEKIKQAFDCQDFGQMQIYHRSKLRIDENPDCEHNLGETQKCILVSVEEAYFQKLYEDDNVSSENPKVLLVAVESKKPDTSEALEETSQSIEKVLVESAPNEPLSPILPSVYGKEAELSEVECCVVVNAQSTFEYSSGDDNLPPRSRLKPFHKKRKANDSSDSDFFTADVNLVGNPNRKKGRRISCEIDDESDTQNEEEISITTENHDSRKNGVRKATVRKVIWMPAGNALLLVNDYLNSVGVPLAKPNQFLVMDEETRCLILRQEIKKLGIDVFSRDANKLQLQLLTILVHQSIGKVRRDASNRYVLVK